MTVRSFALSPGKVIGAKYVVEELLGKGWEGEVYRVVERGTEVPRAAKLFYPARNRRDRTVRFHARKLERLRRCEVLVRYHHTEIVRWRGERVTALISELVEGRVLEDFVLEQPGGRMPTFEALHLVHSLARGLECVHDLGEYHGDLHWGNVMVRRVGIGFETRLFDLFHWGPPSKTMLKEDVCNLVRILYDAVGGRDHYASQPRAVKEVCRGLRRDLILERFRSAGDLRRHLEGFHW